MKLCLECLDNGRTISSCVSPNSCRAVLVAEGRALALPLGIPVVHRPPRVRHNVRWTGHRRTTCLRASRHRRHRSCRSLSRTRSERRCGVRPPTAGFIDRPVDARDLAVGKAVVLGDDGDHALPVVGAAAGRPASEDVDDDGDSLGEPLGRLGHPLAASSPAHAAQRLPRVPRERQTTQALASAVLHRPRTAAGDVRRRAGPHERGRLRSRAHIRKRPETRSNARCAPPWPARHRESGRS
jgi:hypothetical protein